MASPALEHMVCFDPEAYRQVIVDAVGVNPDRGDGLWREETATGLYREPLLAYLRQCVVLLDSAKDLTIIRRVSDGTSRSQSANAFFAALPTVVVPALVKVKERRRAGFMRVKGSTIVQAMWMEDPARVAVDLRSYLPPREIRRGYEHPPRVFSEYAGPGVTLAEIDGVDPHGEAAREAVAAWRDHVERRICRGEPALITAVWGFIASIVQSPGVKRDVLLTVFGDPGEGKGTFTEVLTELVGEANTHKISQPSQAGIGGRFNGAIAGCVLLILDEVVWPGDKAAREMIKGLVSERRQRVERKGVEAAEENIIAAPVITSNGHAVAVTAGDRRVIACEIINELHALPKAEQNRFRHTLGLEVRGEHRPLAERRRRLAAIARFMMDPEHLRRWDGTAPATAALAHQAALTLDFVESWLKTLLEERDARIWGAGNPRRAIAVKDVQASMRNADCNAHATKPEQIQAFLSGVFKDAFSYVPKCSLPNGRQQNAFLWPEWGAAVRMFGHRFKMPGWAEEQIKFAAEREAEKARGAGPAGEGFDERVEA